MIMSIDVEKVFNKTQQFMRKTNKSEIEENIL